MFKVKVTVVELKGNTERYPCIFQHKVGDEIIFDGETMTGRLCPDVMPAVIPHMYHVMYGGPRYHTPHYYAPWKYFGTRKLDPSMKERDGFGWKAVIGGYKEPPYHMTHGSTIWGAPNMSPLATEKAKLPVRVTCPDLGTGVTFDITPFGLCDSGPYHLPVYRREMSIAEKIKAKPGIEVGKILDEFTEWEKNEVYPVLSGPLFEELLEELELAGHVEIREGRAYPTKDLPPRWYPPIPHLPAR